MSESTKTAPVWARVIAAGVVLIGLAALNVLGTALSHEFTLTGMFLTLGVLALTVGIVMFLFTIRA